MKIGVKFKLDVKKIKKELLFVGEKGTYLDCTCFLNLDEQDQYGNNGFVSQDVSKEEREAGEKGPILGNGKIFYRDGDNKQTKQPDNGQDFDEGSIPF